MNGGGTGAYRVALRVPGFPGRCFVQVSGSGNHRPKCLLAGVNSCRPRTWRKRRRGTGQYQVPARAGKLLNQAPRFPSAGLHEAYAICSVAGT